MDGMFTNDENIQVQLEEVGAVKGAFTLKEANLARLLMILGLFRKIILCII
jgi:hypothetical protein